jgi:hypothetical protein
LFHRHGPEGEGEELRRRDEGDEQQQRRSAQDQASRAHAGSLPRARMRSTLIRPTGLPDASITGSACLPSPISRASASCRVVVSESAFALRAARLHGLLHPDQRQKTEGPLRRSRELFHEGRRRMGEQLRGRRVLQEPRLIHDGDAVAEMEGLVHVVRDENDGGAEAALDRQEILLRLARITGSSAPNGSSIRSRAGFAASARATPTRCCCPPDSSCGNLPANSAGSSWNRSSSSSTRAATLFRSQPRRRGTVAMFCDTVR